MRFSAERARFSAEQAHVNFSYKTAVDRLELAAPYNRISDWLFLNANDGSNRRTKISRWLQEYEGCLSAAISKSLVFFFFHSDQS